MAIVSVTLLFPYTISTSSLWPYSLRLDFLYLMVHRAIRPPFLTHPLSLPSQGIHSKAPDCLSSYHSHQKLSKSSLDLVLRSWNLSLQCPGEWLYPHQVNIPTVMSHKCLFLALEVLKLVKKYFEDGKFTNQQQEVKMYVWWALCPNGPACFAEPTPESCPFDCASPQYIVSCCDIQTLPLMNTVSAPPWKVPVHVYHCHCKEVPCICWGVCDLAKNWCTEFTTQPIHFNSHSSKFSTLAPSLVDLKLISVTSQ